MIETKDNMGEIIMVSSMKDDGGIGFYDLSTGSTFSTTLKNCTCDTGGIVLGIKCVF